MSEPLDLEGIAGRYDTAAAVSNDPGADLLSRTTTATASAYDVPALVGEVRLLRGALAEQGDARIDYLLRDSNRLRAAVEAALRLHRVNTGMCLHCVASYPCDTVRALTTEEPR